MRPKYKLAMAGMALLAASAAAVAEKGLGPLYNTKYQSNGIYQTISSKDQRVALDEESIETINCGGCDTILYGPGTIFHLRNTSKKPVCVAFEFKPLDRRMDFWGNRAIYYLKAGKKLNKIGGFYVINGGESGTLNMGYDYSLTAMEPSADKTCPDITWAL